MSALESSGVQVALSEALFSWVTSGVPEKASAVVGGGGRMATDLGIYKGCLFGSSGTNFLMRCSFPGSP